MAHDRRIRISGYRLRAGKLVKCGAQKMARLECASEHSRKSEWDALLSYVALSIVLIAGIGEDEDCHDVAAVARHIDNTGRAMSNELNPTKSSFPRPGCKRAVTALRAL